jgi:hypothetical protein
MSDDNMLMQPWALSPAATLHYEYGITASVMVTCTSLGSGATNGYCHGRGEETRSWWALSPAAALHYENCWLSCNLHLYVHVYADT